MGSSPSRSRPERSRSAPHGRARSARSSYADLQKLRRASNPSLPAGFPVMTAAAEPQLEANPLLAIDYLRRAYLLTGDEALRRRAKRVFTGAGLDARARDSVERHLAAFATAPLRKGRPRGPGQQRSR